MTQLPDSLNGLVNNIVDTKMLLMHAIRRDEDLDTRDCTHDASYCLDAPELIPAGSTVWFCFDDVRLPHLGWPEQTTWSREP